MLEVCYADGSRKGWKPNAVFSTELPKSLLWGQPAKLFLTACTPCSMFTAVVDSEVFQIWVHSPNTDAVSLQPPSTIYSFSQSTPRNEGYGPSPPSQPPPFPLLQNK